MAAKKNIDFKVGGIGKILAEKNLSVPLYQRPYAWETKHVKDFLTDLKASIGEKAEEYFLGTIVILDDEKQREVVDGQQRLATTMILLAAIRDYFEEEGDHERAVDVEKEYLLAKDFRTREILPNLKLGKIDHDFFQKYVLNFQTVAERKTIPTARESHKGIKAAAQEARKFIRSITATEKEPFEILSDWIEFVSDKARIIKVTVPDTANAFTIFETLNDRGLDLAISDLLKNFIFKKSGDRLPEAEQRWVEMLGVLSAVDAEAKIVEFIRHVWASQYGLIREKVLYENIKQKTNSKQSAIDLVNLLCASALAYSAILNQNHEFWRDYSPNARVYMGTLNLMKMTQVRPLILSVLSSFDKKEAEKTLRALVSWSVRFYILGQLGGSQIETFYAQRAKDVTSGAITNYSQLKKAAAKDVPSDSQFKEAFETATVGQSYLSRYYLLTLEKFERGDNDAELVANNNSQEVNLEHIMPRNPDGTGAWKISEEVRETHTNRIGNLALMKNDENSTSGNESFSKKRLHYAKSKLILTKKIATYEGWGKAQIEERQKALALIALKAWPL